ncbi:TIGR00725 family protein [Cuniculiplasma sp. SKW4]|uniref:TIGR00725 family protein n=1 Tax=Cuniculiplasma sp. SKW4 TaxID=3400171 RepID=UPI003FD50140
MVSRLYIGVIGGANPEEKYLKMAFEVGQLLAKSKCIIVCGGLNGVMREVARGAREEGGIVIGILPGFTRKMQNEFLTYSIPSGIGYARNFLITRASDALIAIDGSNGTISEESFGISEGKDIISLGSMPLKKTRNKEGNFYPVETPKEAVEKAILSAEEHVKNAREYFTEFDS